MNKPEYLSYEGFLDDIRMIGAGNEDSHSRKLCFVLGAGASRSSGIRSGQELIRLWDEELGKRNHDAHEKWKEDQGINEDNISSFYSAFYQERYRKYPEAGLAFLEHEMEEKLPSVGYIALANIMTQTEHNVVLTTNFDHLIEDAIGYYTDKLPIVITHEDMAYHIKPNLKRPLIIKLHRDVLFNPRNTVDDVNALPEKWYDALDRIFTAYTPVFVGYSGNDGGLMGFLSRPDNLEKFRLRKWKLPYWLVYGDKLEDTISTFVAGADGYYVKHPGFDLVAMHMQEKMGLTLPNKEFFDNKSNKWHDVMLKTLEEATKKDPLSAEYHRSLSITLMNTRRKNDAIAEAREAVRLEPHNARYQNSLGLVLHSFGEYEEALIAKKEAIRLDPHNALYHSNVGVTLHSLKRYSEALEEKRIAAQMEPERALFHGNLGVTLRELKHYDEALVEARASVSLDPQDPWFRAMLGLCLYDMERFDEALLETQAALKMDPQDRAILHQMAKIYQSMGKTEEVAGINDRLRELEDGSINNARQVLLPFS